MRLADFSFRNLTTALRSFFDHHMLDWGAAMTFYAALSLVPALVIIAGLVGLFGDSAISALADNLKNSNPGPARAIALDAVNEVRTSSFSASLALLAGIGGTIWSASGYVGCFLRGSGVIHHRTERVPFWKLRPLQILITCGVILSVVAIAVAVVVTGPLAEQVAGLIGVEQVVAEIWDLAKWPLIVVLVMTIFAVLYWAGPEARGRGFRWLTPGGIVATGAWAAGSAAYAVYISAFPDYNKVYGSLGAIIGFLAWLWGSNMAMLYGAELNALLEGETDAPADQPSANAAPGSST